MQAFVNRSCHSLIELKPDLEFVGDNILVFFIPGRAYDIGIVSIIS